MLQRIAFLSFLLLPLMSAGQQDHPMLPPRLIGADMPFYPQLAEAAHITGWLQILVTVKQGKVVRTELVHAESKGRDAQIWKDGSLWLTNPTLAYLKTWRFDSDVNTSFLVRFTYKIVGAETDQPTTPTMEVLPSLDVNVTARPVKPVVEY